MKPENVKIWIAARFLPGRGYKRGNKANEVVVHVARISQSRRWDRHDCWHQLIDLEMAETIITALIIMISTALNLYPVGP